MHRDLIGRVITSSTRSTLYSSTSREVLKRLQGIKVDRYLGTTGYWYGRVHIGHCGYPGTPCTLFCTVPGTRGLIRLFRPTSYLLRFGTPGRHTQAWASPPPQPVASWPHHHHCWLSASIRSAGRYLERFSSVSRAFLERFFERFWPFLGM